MTCATRSVPRCRRHLLPSVDASPRVFRRLLPLLHMGSQMMKRKTRMPHRRFQAEGIWHRRCVASCPSPAFA